MAEIPVEKKNNLTWLWILLAIIVAALLLWWLLGDDDGDTEQLAGDTVAIEQSADTTPAAETGEMTIAAVVANPDAFYGEEGFTGTVNVGGPLTDRGFWIENDGARMFAVVIDEPAERRVDINPGQTLTLDGGTIREASTISAEGIEGVPLDQDTMNAIADQDAVLVIDEANITIDEDA